MTESQLKEELLEKTEQLSIFKQMFNEMYQAINKPNYPHRQTTLTPREIQVVRLICNGKMSKEIADILSISERTVEKHRENISIKIGSKCVADIIRYGYRRKLV